MPLYRPKKPNYSPPSTILLRADILSEARTLNIPEGFAIAISESVATSVEDYISTHQKVTDLDIKNLVAQELSKFHPDLAYIYRYRDKII